MAAKSVLDAHAVRVANESLWRAHPELNRRALTNKPQDAAYVVEWAHAYQEALKKQPFVITSSQQLNSTGVHPCPTAKPTDCGACINCKRCELALSGINDRGELIDQTTANRLHSTKERIEKGRTVLLWLGYFEALYSLDHFLTGCGEFVQIPFEKVDRMKHEVLPGHKRKFLQTLGAVTGGAQREATKSRLALELSKRGENLTSRQSVKFSLTFASGAEKAEFSDDNIAYYGSSIMSVVDITCIPVGQRCFECSIKNWKAWVADNYDWEGDKQFGDGYWNWAFPSSPEMKEFAEYGCAKPYQRSSASWQEQVSDIQPWKVCFESLEEFQRLVDYRREKEATDQAHLSEERAAGALPLPGPAEEQSNSR
jgi:hypothetical protein